MTRCRTILQLNQGIANNQWIFRLYVRIRIPITLMTSSAIGFIAGTWPGEYFRIVLMTHSTVAGTTVISRIIGTGMSKPNRCPSRRAVTGITSPAGGEMTIGLTGSRDGIVATTTITGYVAMVKTDGRYPGFGGMTNTAFPAGSDMLRMLAGGYFVVMARTAEAGGQPMVHFTLSPIPVIGTVTFHTICNHLGMNTFSRPIFLMAISTTAGDIRVIKVDRRPSGGQMTISAFIIGDNMIGGLTRGPDTVMTFAARP